MLVYSLFVSKSLLKPILQINKKLSNMDENSLIQIDKKDLPIEFHSLANSINTLTNRIETYVKFKKELFIGAAHELKTPLAVMKLKTEVTLKKKREVEQYEEVLNLTVKQIDEMNKMISSILDIGRTEGAQFEQTVNLDLVEYIKKKTNDYRMLSAQKNIIITFFSNVNHLNTSLQLTLFNQILQNFVQNAIKFTPNEKSIAIRLKKTKEKIIITVTDEGIGIPENVDLFAPFKRIGNQSGVGLGLFLAKNAADALRAKITLVNRDDQKSGCVAKLILRSNTSKDII
jgi:two-component system OmpR family sensor kinase